MTASEKRPELKIVGRDGAHVAPAPSDPAIEDTIASRTDHYFRRTKAIVERFGDVTVKYAVFMRRPVIFSPKIAVDWIEQVARERDVTFEIELCHAEGDWVGAGDPLLYLTGGLQHLVDLETLYLQKLGAACVSAHNAFLMCCDMPKSAFLAMDARHCTGPDMAELMAYAASVGSAAARRDKDAIGFIGNATDATAHFFGQKSGMGTMPHALIGYAGSTLRAAEMFREVFPDDKLTVLVDYFGRELTDALTVCRRFPDMASKGDLSIRLDTHGGRYVEGLDPAKSYEVLERHVPKATRQYRTESELRYLIGTGVSAAAIFHLRERLDEEGFQQVRIVASSGFGPEKCRVMGSINAPIDVVGTGSYLPQSWSETYATADVIEYDGTPRVKVGREFLLRNG
ncbi:nicotinate phosphoribosyltransferase [Minwuia sp.]|uniref:nicotinate phosphoribosyltransferase n=1 Tax=Minwuia sp. TaxID=2493630 RepID=UPI003A8EB8C1